MNAFSLLQRKTRGNRSTRHCRVCVCVCVAECVRACACHGGGDGDACVWYGLCVCVTLWSVSAHVRVLVVCVCGMEWCVCPYVACGGGDGNVFGGWRCGCVCVLCVVNIFHWKKSFSTGKKVVIAVVHSSSPPVTD